MYKRRRLSQPSLPSSPDEADICVSHSRYAEINGDKFYRGLTRSDDCGSAIVFATTQQLELLRSAKNVYFDATFKVVPQIYYQLLTVFVAHSDTAFPVFYALMTRKTQQMYHAVFQFMKTIVPDFSPECAMADYEEASVSAFTATYPEASLKGCWFHYAQAIVKRLQKTGLKLEYSNVSAVRDVVHCLLGLPLLPAGEIVAAWTDIYQSISNDMEKVIEVRQLLDYVKRQWLDRQSVGPDRLSVHDSHSRTNNVLETYHSTLRRRIKVTHPNLFIFLSQLSKATIDYMNDMARIDNGLRISRSKKKLNLLNEARIKACTTKFNAGSYSRLQFLRAVCHSVGAHTEVLQVRADSDDDNDTNANDQLLPESEVATSQTSSSTPVIPSVTLTFEGVDDSCEVCLLVPRAGVALVPCGHSRFCSSCADTVAAIGNGCPICRSPITLVLRLFN